MNRQQRWERILDEKIVAIIRSKTQAEVAPIIDALVSAGIGVLEITSNTPNFAEEIANARARHPKTLIGAGTILDADLAKIAIEAGAQFLVTPNTDQALVEIAHASGLPVIMGAFTPTEIRQATKFGADAVKLFPAGVGGGSPDYYTSIRGPFDTTAFFAVGGVRLENLEAWLQAGVQGVGVGGPLTALHPEHGTALIKKTAEAMLNIVEAYGNGQ